MTNRISLPVFAVNLTFSVFIFGYVYFLLPTTVLSRIVLGASALSTITQLWLFFSASAQFRKFYLYIVFLHVLYLFAEVLVYVLVALSIVRTDAQFLANKLEANTEPWAQYDSIIGYKGIPGSFRNVKYSNSELVYDHVSHINNQGWFSANEFLVNKPNGIKRYAVLGDSFSAGFNIPISWVDAASNQLDSIELYNFALEGIGINNWHLIYFNEILKYDFDGLIIAASNEQYGIPDMDRRLMIMHSEDDATYIGQFNEVPTASTFYSQLANMTKGYALVSNAKMDQLICVYKPSCESEFSWPAPDLYFLSTAITVFKQLGAYFKLEHDHGQYKEALAARFPESKVMERFADYKQKYPYTPLLEEIVKHCNQTGKEVILVTIPDVSGVHDSVLAQRTHNEMQVLANAMQLRYFNGFSCFKRVPAAAVKDYYYQYDLHWNQNGASLFAAHFANWLSAQNNQP